MDTISLFQGIMGELTGLEAGCCKLIEASGAGAEAAAMLCGQKNGKLFVDRYVSENNISGLKAFCKEQGIEVICSDYAAFRPTAGCLGAIIEYPNSEGSVEEYAPFISAVHRAGGKVAVVADPMALVMLKAPSELGADIVMGSLQSFKAGETCFYFASKEEGASHENALDDAGAAVAYIVKNGVEGIKAIASRIHGMASYFNDALEVYGYGQENTSFFGTLKISLPEEVDCENLIEAAKEYALLLYPYSDGHVGVRFDDSFDEDKLSELIEVFASAADNFPTEVEEEDWSSICSLDESLLRSKLNIRLQY